MSIGRTILDCKLALCHLASDMKYAGAVYEARTYGSVRGMRRKPHPTRCLLLSTNINNKPSKRPHTADVMDRRLKPDAVHKKVTKAA